MRAPVFVLPVPACAQYKKVVYHKPIERQHTSRSNEMSIYVAGSQKYWPDKTPSPVYGSRGWTLRNYSHLVWPPCLFIHSYILQANEQTLKES